MAEHVQTEQQQRLRDALNALSYEETFAMCVEAVRLLRRGPDGKSRQWNVSKFQQPFYKLLATRLHKEPNEFAGLTNHISFSFAKHVLAFFLWLERAGLAYHLGRNLANPVDHILFLPEGEAFFDAKPDDTSPLLPDWIDRLQKRSPGLPEEVLTILADARQCLDALLIRPAIMLAGVAYELAVEAVVKKLVDANKIAASTNEAAAARRISAVRAAIDTALQASGNGPERKDDLYAARLACDFADMLRRRRNDAAHTKPRFPVDQSARAEAEELLVLAARNVPSLWSSTSLL